MGFLSSPRFSVFWILFSLRFVILEITTTPERRTGLPGHHPPATHHSSPRTRLTRGRRPAAVSAGGRPQRRRSARWQVTECQGRQPALGLSVHHLRAGRGLASATGNHAVRASKPRGVRQQSRPREGLSPHDHCPGQSRLPCDHRCARHLAGAGRLGAGEAGSRLPGSCVLLPPSQNRLLKYAPSVK